MKLPFLNRQKKQEPKRPSYVNLRPRVDNSKILSQAKKRQQKTKVIERREAIALPQFLKDFNLKRIVLTILVLALFAGIYFFLKNTSIFNVKSIEIISDKPENYTVIKNIVDQYNSKNIIFVSSWEIESKIKDKLSSVSTVFVDKSLDGKLKVEVIEDIPIFYEANNSGIYLINQTGEVMEVVEPKDHIALTETDKLLIDNKLAADSEQSRLRYLADVDGPERSKVVWKDVPVVDKETALRKLHDDLNARLSEYMDKLADQLKEDKFKNLIGSFVPSTLTYKVGDKLSIDNLNFVSLVLDFFKSKNLKISRVVWDSDYTLKASVDGGPDVLLSVKRIYTDQFVDLNTLIYHGQFNGSRIVDVRSSNYSVVR